jgi:hypothetical protein
MDSLPLAHVVVLTPTREGVHNVTRNAITDIEVLGARRIDLAGCADIALARNILLGKALGLAPEYKVIAFVDDDIVFTRAQFQLLVERAEREDYPVSAVYPTNELSLAGYRQESGRWLTGLGCWCVRRDLLAAYAETLPELSAINGTVIRPFCQTGPSVDGKMWLSEDYWLSQALGGVVLARLAVTHYKRFPLTADEASMRAIFGEPDPEAQKV